MWALFIVICDPRADPLARLQTSFEGAQEDAFVFEGAPQPFDHAVVDPATSPVHRNLHFRVFEHVGEIGACELAALVRIEDLGRAKLAG